MNAAIKTVADFDGIFTVVAFNLFELVCFSSSENKEVNSLLCALVVFFHGCF
jgi:hypothetical protein